MTELTLKDSTPTTTITFASFKEIFDRLEAKNFVAYGLPDNDGAIIIHLLSWVRVFKIKFQLLDDPYFPSSGDSAADKWADLVVLLRTGGDNDGKLTLTFDSEDSTPGTPQTESYNGYVNLLSKRSIAGEHVSKIDGTFEFWEGL